MCTLETNICNTIAYLWLLSIRFNTLFGYMIYNTWRWRIEHDFRINIGGGVSTGLGSGVAWSGL